MFLKIEPFQNAKYAGLLDQMFRLRKNIFADELEWDVPVSGDWEKDSYDAFDPVYLVWTNVEQTKLISSVRLMPTMGPTLLNDVFNRTFPSHVDLQSPSMWEATRMCVDKDALKKFYPNISYFQAMSIMVAFTCEVACHAGIETVISNYEPHIARIYKSAGAVFDEIGRSDTYGKRAVCCGVFDTSESTLKVMLKKLNITRELTQLNLDDCLLSSEVTYAEAC